MQPSGKLPFSFNTYFRSLSLNPCCIKMSGTLFLVSLPFLPPHHPLRLSGLVIIWKQTCLGQWMLPLIHHKVLRIVSLAHISQHIHPLPIKVLPLASQHKAPNRRERRGRRQSHQISFLGQKPYFILLPNPSSTPCPAQGGQEADSSKNSLHSCWLTDGQFFAVSTK